METKNTTHKSITVIFKDSNREPIRYADATIGIEEVTESYVISAIIQLQLNEKVNDDDVIQYGYFKVIERIAMSEVLRVYTLDESK
jgi:hypothetical protein